MIKFIIFAIVSVLYFHLVGFEQFVLTALTIILFRLFKLEEKVMADE